MSKEAEAGAEATDPGVVLHVADPPTAAASPTVTPAGLTIPWMWVAGALGLGGFVGGGGSTLFSALNQDQVTKIVQAEIAAHEAREQAKLDVLGGKLDTLDDKLDDVQDAVRYRLRPGETP